MDPQTFLEQNPTLKKYTFLDSALPAALLSDTFWLSAPPEGNAVSDLPTPVREWIVQRHPRTTHVRVCKFGEHGPLLKWWIGGWASPTQDPSAWGEFIYTTHRIGS